MSTKTDYTDAEWQRLERAPIIAGLAISIADPGGPIELAKETTATLKTLIEATQSQEHGSLATEVSKAAVELLQVEHKSPVGDFKPKGALAATEILDELRAVNALLVEKATPEEADDFRALLVEATERAAKAAKEGGFFGFHAERVSAGETAALAQIRKVLGIEA